MYCSHGTLVEGAPTRPLVFLPPFDWMVALIVSPLFQKAPADSKDGLQEA